jgi:hypothetical protein
MQAEWRKIDDRTWIVDGAAVLVAVLTWPTDLAKRTSGATRLQAQDGHDPQSRALGGSP